MQHRQLHICKRPTLSDLNEYVREFFTLESLGIAAAPSVESAEDDRARKILENSTKRTNCGKFETGLLWKNDYVELPDSRPMAEKRLKCLENVYRGIRHYTKQFVDK